MLNSLKLKNREISKFGIGTTGLLGVFAIPIVNTDVTNT